MAALAISAVEHQRLAAVLLDAVTAVAPAAPGELRVVDHEAAVPQMLNRDSRQKTSSIENERKALGSKR